MLDVVCSVICYIIKQGKYLMLNVLQRLMKLTSSFVKIHHRIATTLFTKIATEFLL